MRSRASCRADPGCVAPKWISPIPTAPTRSTAAARSQSRCSFDVLHLLPQFFDLRLDFQRYSGNRERFAFHARRLREHGVGFAMHLLQKKIQFFAQLAGTVQQLGELLQVATQAVSVLTDIAA